MHSRSREEQSLPIRGRKKRPEEGQENTGNLPVEGELPGLLEDELPEGGLPELSGEGMGTGNGALGGDGAGHYRFRFGVSGITYNGLPLFIAKWPAGLDASGVTEEDISVVLSSEYGDEFVLKAGETVGETNKHLQDFGRLLQE